MSGKRTDDAQTRKAIKQLKPPSTTAVLDDDMLKTMNKLKVALGRSKRDANEIQQLLDVHTSKAAPVKHTQRRHPALQFPLSLTPIINILNTNVYLPTDRPLDILVPPAHRYFETNNGSSNSGFGSGSANTTNGNMLVIQQVPLSSTASNSWATIFIKLISDRGGLIGITPEVDWSYQDQWGAGKDWAGKIAGSIIFFTANVWLSVFEADTLAPVSNQPWELWYNSNPVDRIGVASSHSGSFTGARGRLRPAVLHQRL